MTPLVYSLPAASEELAAAVRWYEERRPGLGVQFFGAVTAAITVITAHPEVGEPVPAVAKARRYRIQGYPYYVVYRPRANAIVIVAFAHTRRRPGFWKQRS